MNAPQQTGPEPVALYARVSTEDQAERQTVQSQLDFLRKLCDLHGLPIAGEYVDDGVSGTVPLDRREDGRRLLMDAEAGRFKTVVVYRLDRLGRSLSSLLSAHDALAGYGVAIRSGSEPFDTSTPVGMFLFQLLGSLAQLERSTISERTALGRNRVAAGGKYTGGPIPLGYDLDEHNLLILSARPVPQVGMTEAEMVRDIFTRIAAGESTLNRECARLTGLGVPRRQRYGVSERRRREGKDAAVIERNTGWGISSLGGIIHNPVYKGAGAVDSRYGHVTRPTPALVDPETWERAQSALKRNRSLSKKNAKNTYLLRGLVQCSHCGLAYVGMTSSGARKYRCNSNAGRAASRPEGRCGAKILPADWLEDAVWNECREFILNPGSALDDARKKLRERMATSAGFDDRRRTVLAELAAKETERERILTMFRRGKISSEEAEDQLDAIAREAGQMRELLESMRAQAALIDAQEEYLTDSMALLGRLREGLAEIETTNDLARKREVIERYVRKITVDTRDVGPRKKEADLRVYLRLKPDPIAVDNAMCSPDDVYRTVEIERGLVAA